MPSKRTSKSNSQGSNGPRVTVGARSYDDRAMERRVARQRASAQAMRAEGLDDGGLRTRSVGQIKREAGKERRRNNRRRFGRGAIAAAVVAVLAIALAIAGVFVYFSEAFTVESVEVQGAAHLTDAEVMELAQVPEGTTLLRVDTGSIISRLKMDAWVESASIERVFPSTLVIHITERTIAAVVEVPTVAGYTRDWAIGSDGTWLMPIPDKDSEAGQQTSQQIYADAESVLRITDVPYTCSPQIGAVCTDSNVNNALSIVAGMTTSLKDQVKSVSATDAQSTTLRLESGVEIAFGTDDDIRSKERVCLKILEEYAGRVAYINVRDVENPTWRSV